MARDKDALTGGEEMTHEVRDGVRLPCPWRTLHKNALMRAEPSDDLELLFVRGKWEEYLLWSVDAGGLWRVRFIDDLDESLDSFGNGFAGLELREDLRHQPYKVSLGALTKDQRRGEHDLGLRRGTEGRPQVPVHLGVGGQGVGPLFQDAGELGRVADFVAELLEPFLRRRLLRGRRAILGVEHFLFETQIRAVTGSPDSEHTAFRVERNARLGRHEVASDLVVRGRRPYEKPETDDHVVSLAEFFLLLVDREERVVDLLHRAEYAILLGPRTPTLGEVALPRCRDSWALVQ